MLWRIAFSTLLSDRGKLATGLVGVVFSVILVNIQGGLFFGLMNKASLLVDRSGADIWVGHRGMHNVDFPHNIPARWLSTVRSTPGVSDAETLIVGFSEMTLPGGGFEGVTIVGVSPRTDLGKAWDIVEGPSDAIDAPNGVIVDLCDESKLAYPKIGDIREIGGQRARIAGKSHGVLSFLVTPYVFTTRDRALQFLGGDPSKCSYILVRVEGGASVSDVCKRIEEKLPSVMAVPSETYGAISINFWMTRTGIGLSFGTATVLGLLVGLIMVAQTLYAMVLDRISEFATMKAIGASERAVLTVLLSQAGAIAVIGVAIGLCLTVLLKTLISKPQAAVEIPLWLYVASALLVSAICLVASMLPYVRVRRVDPHSVLQG
jgi:putative ABC transport system permease protein